MAGIVSRSHDLGETLGNVVDLVAKRLDADVCSVYLIDPADLSHLVLSATVGLAKSSVGHVRLALGEGLVGHVAENGEPMAFADAQSHPAYRYFPETGEERFTTLMAAPLRVRGAERGFTIGALVVQTRERREFSEVDLELLDTCAQVVAPVVLNAHLLAVVAGGQERRSRLLEELARSGVGVGAEPAKPAERERRVRGIATSRGIALGPIYFLGDALDLERVTYSPNPDREAELRDLAGALEGALRELHDVRDDVGERFGPDFAAVFNTHIQMLEDKGLVRRLEEETRRGGNAFEAIRSVLGDYARMFAAIEDPYFRERGADVEDVGQRVVARLLGVRQHDRPLTEGAVVVASNLLPAHFATLDVEKVAAFVTEHGGPTSHGAIFARALEIPAVTGAAGILHAARAGESAIVDGDSGTIFLSPEPKLVAEYQRAQHRALVAVEHLDTLASRPAETRDGHRVSLTA
ncbi:MAG: phosphoenolpyruvate-utilizing N-terminal domain-containing protein, partial [Myxococcota bacterium]